MTSLQPVTPLVYEIVERTTPQTTIADFVVGAALADRAAGAGAVAVRDSEQAWLAAVVVRRDVPQQQVWCGEPVEGRVQ